MLASSQLGQSPVSSSQSSSGTPPKQRVQTIDIQWVFFFLSRIFPPSFFRYCPRAEIQSHTIFVTKWVFSFLPLQPPGILATASHPATGRDYESPHIVGFSFFYHEPYQLQRINTAGGSFKTTPMGTIICKSTVHGLGLIP